MFGTMSIVYEGKLRMPQGTSLVPLFLLTVLLTIPIVLATPINHRTNELTESVQSEGLISTQASRSAEHANDGEDLARTVFIKEYVYNKRRKRELRTARKIESSPTQVQKPTNYPFIMAEMVPGSVKTRHPAIIAINNCPAYYIADHEGKCRQVFQYTVNFGENSPRFNPQPFQPSRNTFDHKRRFAHQFLNDARNKPSFLTGVPGSSRLDFRSPPTTSTEVPLHPTTPTSFENKYIPPAPSHQPTSSSSISPRLLAVLRAAAKKRLDFLVKASNGSGESNDNSDLDNLRKKILGALKNSSDKSLLSSDIKASETNSNQSLDNGKVESEIKTTTADYDD